MCVWVYVHWNWTWVVTSRNYISLELVISNKIFLRLMSCKKITRNFTQINTAIYATYGTQELSLYMDNALFDHEVPFFQPLLKIQIISLFLTCKKILQIFFVKINKQKFQHEMTHSFFFPKTRRSKVLNIQYFSNC